MLSFRLQLLPFIGKLPKKFQFAEFSKFWLLANEGARRDEDQLSAFCGRARLTGKNSDPARPFLSQWENMSSLGQKIIFWFFYWVK